MDVQLSRLPRRRRLIACLVLSILFSSLCGFTIREISQVGSSMLETERLKTIYRGDHRNANGNDNNNATTKLANDNLFTKCRFELEDHLEMLHGQWTNESVPLLQSLVAVGNFSYLLFNTKNVKEKYHYLGVEMHWKCNGKEPAIVAARDAHKHTLVVGCPVVTEQKSNNGTVPLDYITLNTTKGFVVYRTEKLYTCDKQIHNHERPSFSLSSSASSSNKDGEMAVPSSKSPSGEERRIFLGACTSVAGDKSRSQILQWVEFHRLIGIEHFWIYLNEDRSNYLQNNSSPKGIIDNNLPVRPYITYVPYNYPGRNFFSQQLVQTECIYRSRAFGVDWLALHDVDEYFHITLVPTTSPDNTDDQPPSTVRDLIEWIVKKNPNDHPIAGLSFKNWFYGRGSQKNTSELLLDYTWRRPTITWDGREKVIVNVLYVDYFSVHMITSANSGAVTRWVDPRTEGYHQHYKLADYGPSGANYFKNYLEGGNDDPSLKNMYKEQLLQTMMVLDG